MKHFIGINRLRTRGTIPMVMVALFLQIIVPGLSFGAASHEGVYATEESRVDFTSIQGKEWILLEVRSPGKTINMDRGKLETANMGGFYTISFNGNQANGQGAPNRYFAPYNTGPNQSLNISNIASTMMLSLVEPDGLKESDFFGFLNRVVRWSMRSGKLELYCTTGMGAEAILVFSAR